MSGLFFNAPQPVACRCIRANAAGCLL